MSFLSANLGISSEKYVFAYPEKYFLYPLAKFPNTRTDCVTTYKLLSERSLLTIPHMSPADFSASLGTLASALSSSSAPFFSIHFVMFRTPSHQRSLYFVKMSLASASEKASKAGSGGAFLPGLLGDLDSSYALASSDRSRRYGVGVSVTSANILSSSSYYYFFKASIEGRMASRIHRKHSVYHFITSERTPALLELANFYTAGINTFIVTSLGPKFSKSCVAAYMAAA